MLGEICHVDPCRSWESDSNTSSKLLENHCYSQNVATEWSFLTNHGRALLCIAHDPGVRLREIAETLGITERSAYAIVSDLTAAGYVVKKRDGRRNRYVIQQHRRLQEPTLRERTVGDILELLVVDKRRTRTAGAKKPSPTTRKRQKRR